MEDLKQVIAGANQLTDEQAFKDLDAVVAWAGKNARANTEKMGITGFCRGGRTVWMYDSHQSKIDAGVAWYGGLSPAEPAIKTTPLDAIDKLHGSVLGLYGGADQGIPQEQVDKLSGALKASSNKKAKDSTIHVYPGTPHGFNADYRPSYRKEAADDGWKRMLAWFKKNGVA
jgi:carboxymethylenebutenolidase